MPWSGWLAIEGLGLVPEAFIDNGLVPAGVGLFLVHSQAAIGPVLQDFVQDDLVEGPAGALADAVDVQLAQDLGDRDRSVTNRWKMRRTISASAGSMTSCLFSAL